MDALEFIKAIKQMLSAGANNSTVQKYISAYKKNDCEGMVKAAEQWAAEHPAKTRQSEFLKLFPEARIDKSTGVLTICPAELTKECRDDRGACGAYSIETCVCEPCRREFWLAEVEDA